MRRYLCFYFLPFSELWCLAPRLPCHKGREGETTAQMNTPSQPVHCPGGWQRIGQPSEDQLGFRQAPHACCSQQACYWSRPSSPSAPPAEFKAPDTAQAQTWGALRVHVQEGWKVVGAED